MAPPPVVGLGRSPGSPFQIFFSPFRLDLHSGRLLRHGEAIALRPKTWAVLVYLAERPGALIGKDALLDAVWPDTEVTAETLDDAFLDSPLLRAVATPVCFLPAEGKESHP